MIRRAFLITALIPGLLLVASAAHAGERFITLASTTSTENSGLFAHLLPIFTARTGIEVRVVAVGTGQAIRLARAGDADALLVHDTPSEERFVADGFGVRRLNVMYNDYVIVGPRSDPAQIGSSLSLGEALRRIHAALAGFISRGDDSGTHKAERRLWRAAGVDPSTTSGTSYREVGSGMGAALNTAASLDAYTLTDRGTWIAFRNKQDLALLVEGDAGLLNQYSVIRVDPTRHPHVKAEEAKAFVDWLTSAEGQGAIAAFKVSGQQLFFPNAASEGL